MLPSTSFHWSEVNSQDQSRFKGRGLHKAENTDRYDSMGVHLCTYGHVYQSGKGRLCCSNKISLSQNISLGLSCLLRWPTLCGMGFSQGLLPSKVSHTLSVECQFSSVTQPCATLCDPMGCSMPNFLVHHQLPELAQTQILWVADAIQPSHPLSSPSPPAFNLSQHQGLFQWISSSHQVAKVLELQLQHQSFQWIFKIDFL